MAGGLRVHHEGGVSVPVSGCHGDQVIGLIDGPRFSIRVHQIRCSEQPVDRALQGGVALGLAVGVKPIILPLCKVQVLFVDVDFALGAVIVDPPGISLAVGIVAVAVVITWTRRDGFTHTGGHKGRLICRGEKILGQAVIISASIRAAERRCFPAPLETELRCGRQEDFPVVVVVFVFVFLVLAIFRPFVLLSFISSRCMVSIVFAGV